MSYYPYFNENGKVEAKGAMVFEIKYNIMK